MSRFLFYSSMIANLFFALLTGPASADATASAHRLSYVASYQGLLSAGIRLDIAGVQLELAPGGEAAELQARMTISTQGYDGADALFPIRFCYQSRLDSELGATLESNWWSRIGSKATRGQLSFDRQQRKVLRLHAERKLQDEPEATDANDLIQTAYRDENPNQDRDEVPFPPGSGPMDRLAMLLWLRRQPLAVGSVLQPAVTNGRKLTAYRIVVEGRETIALDGKKRPSLKIRFEPKDADKPDAAPTWMWLSDDTEHLPLRFYGAKGFGRFELRLLSADAGPPQACHIAEAAGLSLPAP